MSPSVWFEHDYIVNIVLCLGAVHYQCSSLNTGLQLACSNTHSTSTLLMLVFSQGMGGVTQQQGSDQPETNFKLASYFSPSSLNDPKPNMVH